jgi:DNA-binding transcriptional ArsR family regulator
VARKHDADPANITKAAARAVAETMHALSTPSRVRILARLAAGPCSVSKLARDIDLEQPAVSQQLRVLRNLGLVSSERDGKKVIYALSDDNVRVLLTAAVAHALDSE